MEDFNIFGIDIPQRVLYYYSMGKVDPKCDNLLRLMEGVSLLDEQDRERITGVLDTLDFADTKVRTEILPDAPVLNTEMRSVKK